LEKRTEEPEEVANNLWNEWLRKVSVVADQGVGRRRLRKEIILDWDREVAKIIQLKNHYRKIRDNSQGEDRQSASREHRILRKQAKDLLTKRRVEKQKQLNDTLISFKGKNERAYWNVIYGTKQDITFHS